MQLFVYKNNVEYNVKTISNIFTVCDRVCRRRHSIERQILTVQIYHECLGQPLHPKDRLNFKCPSPLVLKDLSSTMMTFVYKSELFKTALDTQAEITYGKIKWSQKDTTQLIIECTLTKDVNDCKSLAKTWKSNMKDVLIRMLDDLLVEEIRVMPAFWQEVLELVKEGIISDCQRVIILGEDARCVIVIVGYKKKVELLKEEILKMIYKMEEENKKTKGWKTETVTLKSHIFLLLTVDNLIDKTEKKFPGVKVITNQIDRKITIEGQNDDVCRAVISIYDRCNEICEISGGRFSQYKSDFLKRKDVETRVLKMLNNKESCFQVSGSEVLLFAFSDEKATEAAQLLKDEIEEYSFEVFPESAYLLCTEIWREKAKHFESMGYFESPLQLITLKDQQKIIIITFCNLMKEAKQTVENFFLDNMIIEDSKNIPSGVFGYLDNHYSNKYLEISDTLGDPQVQITKSENKLFVKGTKANVTKAMNCINEKVRSIGAQEHTLKKPGIAKHLKGDIGKITLKIVQRDYNCYIEIGREETISSPISKCVAANKKMHETDLKVHKGNATISSSNVKHFHQDGLRGTVKSRLEFYNYYNYKI